MLGNNTTTTMSLTSGALLPLPEPTGGWADTACDWIKVAADTLSLDMVAGMSNETMFIVGVGMKDSVFFGMSSLTSIKAVVQCLHCGVMSADGLMVLASSLNAVSAADRVLNNVLAMGVGLGSLGATTGGLVTVANLFSQVQRGDMPGAVLSAARLIVIIDFGGHSVATGVVTAATVGYWAYSTYYNLSTVSPAQEMCLELETATAAD